MSKKTTKTKKAAKKPTAKQRALAAINTAMNEPSVPLSPAARDIADQANPNLADTPISSAPIIETPAEAVAPKKKARKAADATKEKKPSGLDLAADVLKKAGEPLNSKQILERCLAAGWQTKGATPASTLYAAIVREIMQKGDTSRFRKTDRGLFTVAS